MTVLSFGQNSGRVKTGSPQVLLGGPGGQGTRVEVSPDTSRA